MSYSETDENLDLWGACSMHIGTFVFEQVFEEHLKSQHAQLGLNSKPGSS